MMDIALVENRGKSQDRAKTPHALKSETPTSNDPSVAKELVHSISVQMGTFSAEIFINWNHLYLID